MERTSALVTYLKIKSAYNSKNGDLLHNISSYLPKGRKTYFIFYIVIIGQQNLKYLHMLFFHKFTGLLSESSVSKSDPKELELNQRKIRHGFCWEHGQLQKLISFFAHLSPYRICRRGFKPMFLVVRIFIFCLM